MNRGKVGLGFLVFAVGVCALADGVREGVSRLNFEVKRITPQVFLVGRMNSKESMSGSLIGFICLDHRPFVDVTKGEWVLHRGFWTGVKVESSETVLVSKWIPCG